MRIEKKYKKSGYFWLPGQDDKKIHGVLSIVDGGEADLEVIGLFEGNESSEDPDSFDRILGFVEEDGLVTLDDCFYTKKNHAMGGVSKSTVCVNRVFCGATWDNGEAVTFNTFSFSVDCLDEWMGINGIEIDTDPHNEKTTITYTPSEKRKIELDNGMILEINFAYSTVNSLTEVSLTQRTYFRLESKEHRDLEDFINISFKITNFIGFAVDDVVSIKNVSATSSEILKSVGDKQYPVSIKIYYASTTYIEKIPNKSWHRMFFTYGTIQSNAQDVFNKWINAYEYLSPAMNLYFSTKVGVQKYVDGKFLALAQGLETYHRRTSKLTLMEPDKFSELVSDVLKGCPEEHIEWLQGRLMHGNEINLRKRLKLIIEPFEDYLGEKKERNKLIVNIVDTRNYLTHYSESLADVAVDGIDLCKICQKMEAIFNLHFLKVIGFTDSEIESVVKNCYPLRQKLGYRLELS
ncbi:TPA: HEPN domain-containing protein [Acinetobacter baumannii]